MPRFGDWLLVYVPTGLQGCRGNRPCGIQVQSVSFGRPQRFLSLPAWTLGGWMVGGSCLIMMCKRLQGKHAAGTIRKALWERGP